MAVALFSASAVVCRDNKLPNDDSQAELAVKEPQGTAMTSLAEAKSLGSQGETSEVRDHQRGSNVK